MQFTTSYIVSQLFVFIYYFLVIITYQLKSRKTILLCNLIAVFMMGISYYFLSAYTGVAMAIVGIIRNILFYFDNEKDTKITKENIIKLLFITVILICLTVYTFDGFFSLMSVFATYLYTLSIWQKNTKVYKILGVPTAISGILYNVYIVSILGIIFESFSFVSAVVGLIREKKSIKKTT